MSASNETDSDQFFPKPSSVSKSDFPEKVLGRESKLQAWLCFLIGFFSLLSHRSFTLVCCKLECAWSLNQEGWGLQLELEYSLVKSTDSKQSGSRET